MSEDKKKKKGPKSKLPSRAVAPEELNSAGPGAHDASKERDDRCVPVAFEAIKLIAGLEVLLSGSHINEKKIDVRKTYLPATVELLKLMINKDVKTNEIDYIFACIYQAFEYMKAGIKDTVNENIDRINELVYDLPTGEADEFTIKMLNNVSIKAPRLKELWKPVLDEPTEMKED